jgi:ABC-type branched-subunit amino acid transport system substrate-binding protein
MRPHILFNRGGSRATALALVLVLVATACGTRVTDRAGVPAGAGAQAGGLASTGQGGDSPSLETGTGSAVDTGGASGAADPSAGGAGAGTASAGGAAARAAASTFDVADGNAQGVTDTEIKVGLSGPLSGVVGFLGDEAAGAIDSYFQSVNASGGINGRRIKLITYDDRFDNSQTLANVRKLWEQDKVHAIFLATGVGVLDYVTGNKIPTFVFGVTPDSFASKYNTTFPIVGNALIWTQEVIAGLKSLGVFKPGMRVGMLYDTQVFDVTPYLSYLKKAWEDAGATVVSTDPFNLTDGDCTSLVLKMKNLNIDYWDFQGLGWILCASAASRQQYRPPVGWGNWPTSVAGLASQVGPWVEGIWGGAQGDQPTGAPRQKTAGTDEYINAITRYHPKIATFGHFESPATIGYWSGAKLLVAGIAKQTKPTTEGTLKAITSFEEFDTGITPPIHSLRPDCKTGSEVVWVAQWKWDAAKKEAVRTPATNYFGSPDKDKYGGKCFLTLLSNKIVGG